MIEKILHKFVNKYVDAYRMSPMQHFNLPWSTTLFTMHNAFKWSIHAKICPLSKVSNGYLVFFPLTSFDFKGKPFNWSILVFFKGANLHRIKQYWHQFSNIATHWNQAIPNSLMNRTRRRCEVWTSYFGEVWTSYFGFFYCVEQNEPSFDTFFYFLFL